MIRELISKFNRSLSERMVSARRRHKAPVKIWFEPDINSELAREAARAICVLGETVDMSRTGIGFIVPHIRLKEKYLVGQDRVLNMEIDLPNGKVCMRTVGRRYETVGVHISTERFLVGAHIIGLTGQDQEIYETFLRYGPRRLKGANTGLELEID